MVRINGQVRLGKLLMMNDQIDQITRLHAIVAGRVQGVGFRYFVKQVADSLLITGWVSNLPEGQVEVTAEGSPGCICKMLDALSYGPPGAIVLDVKKTIGRGTGEFKDFQIVNSTMPYS